MTFQQDISPKRRAILDAAIAEFQEKGFVSASMDRISARAEVSKRTVYKHFESKENLFRAIVDLLSERLADVQEVRYIPGQPIRDQLLALGRAEGRLLMSPDVMAMARMLVSETLRNPELAEAAQGKIDKTAAFVAMFEAAHADGALVLDNPTDAAGEFLGLIKAKAFWPVIFGAEIATAEEMAQIVSRSVELILSRYAPNA